MSPGPLLQVKAQESLQAHQIDTLCLLVRELQQVCATLPKCLSPYCAGVHYMFVGKAIEQRSSYRVLGVLLFLQLGVSACARAATLLMRSYARAAEESRAPQTATSSDDTSAATEHSRHRRGQRIVLLDVRQLLLQR